MAGRQSNLAEARFPRQGVSLQGCVMKMNRERITLLLRSVADCPPDLFLPKTPVELVIVAKSVLYWAAAETLSEHNGALTLALCSPPVKIQRRRDWRYACVFELAYRALHQPGCVGAWKNAAVMDISNSGMGLMVESSVKIPRLVELLFQLPDYDAVAKPGRDASAYGASLEARPIKATSRVTHVRPNADGTLLVGLCFKTLSPFDQLRVARFISAVWPE